MYYVDTCVEWELFRNKDGNVLFSYHDDTFILGLCFKRVGNKILSFF